MVELQQILRTIANTWECDQMGHLNVRHYPARESEAVRVMLARCGLAPAVLRARGLRLRFLEKHIRYHRELRPGTPFSVHGGVLEVDPDRLTTYCELRHEEDGALAATIVGKLGLCLADSSQPVGFSPEWLEAASTRIVALPEHGAPRGIEPLTPRPAPTLDDAIAMGMAEEYLGLADPVHVDADGFVEPAGHIARIADGIQHFFLTFSGPRQDGVGGAVLEFRFVSRNEARVGDLIEVRSGLKAMTRKTRSFCHWVFDASTGACLATAEVVAVAFDLEQRRSVEFPPELRKRMLAKIVEGISI